MEIANLDTLKNIYKVGICPSFISLKIKIKALLSSSLLYNANSETPKGSIL